MAESNLVTTTEKNQEPKETSTIMETKEETDSVINMKINEALDDSLPEEIEQAKGVDDVGTIISETQTEEPVGDVVAEAEEDDTIVQQPYSHLQQSAQEVNFTSVENTHQCNDENEGSGVDPVVPPTTDKEDTPNCISGVDPVPPKTDKEDSLECISGVDPVPPKTDKEDSLEFTSGVDPVPPKTDKVDSLECISGVDPVPPKTNKEDSLEFTSGVESVAVVPPKTDKDDTYECISTNLVNSVVEGGESDEITLNKSEVTEEAEQSQSEDDEEEVTDTEDAAPIRRRRGVSSDGEEVLQEDIQSEENISEDERDVIIEDDNPEEGEVIEGEEDEETNEEKEDTENPQFVPRHGMFFMHDNRTDSNEDTKELPFKKKLWDDKGKWGHDRFSLDDQGPKTYRDVIEVYGYDIRERTSPPTYSNYTRGRGNRGRGRGGRSRPLVSDYIENSVRKDDQTEESNVSPPQRRGFGRGLQRGRRRGYPKQTEERMVDDIYEGSFEPTQNYQTSGTDNHNRNTYSDKRYTNSYDERNRLSNLDPKDRTHESDSQRKTNRERNSNWDKRGGGEEYELTNRQDNRIDKRDTRYRNERSSDTYDTKQKNNRFGSEDYRNVQNKFNERDTFDKSTRDSFERKYEGNLGNKDIRYNRRGGFNEGRGRGRPNESPVVETKRSYEKRGGFETSFSSRVPPVEEWPTFDKQPSHVSNNADNLMQSSQATESKNKELMKEDKKEVPVLQAKTETQDTVQSQIVNTHTANKTTSIDDSNVEETAYSRESKSFSQRRHQRSTIKEIPKIPVVPQVSKESNSNNVAPVTNQAPKKLQNFQIRVERGQRMIIDDDKPKEHIKKTEDEPREARQASNAPSGRGGSQSHRYSSQRQRPVEGRLATQPATSESPQHYYEPGYQRQLYQSDGTPPPNTPSDASRTPPHAMLRQTPNISGSPSPRLTNQRVPAQIADTRPAQSQLSDAAALLPNRLPVQGLQPTHPRNTGMLHPAVSMGAHPPQGAFPPTTFVNVHYNPGHPVPQPVQPRPVQQVHPGSPHGQPRPVQGLSGPVQGLAGPAHGHARPAQGLAGPAHGHARPAQGLAGPAQYQIASPVPVQHFPVTSVPPAAVAATQNLPSMGAQMQQEVLIDNHGLTYKGATYYSPEIQLGMQRAPPRRQPQPVRIEAPPGAQYVGQYQENI